jgi:hypothetical protein
VREEVENASVGHCGGSALVLARSCGGSACEEDGGARAGHKELWRLVLRGIGGDDRFIVDVCLPVTGGPTTAFSG